MAWLAKVVAPSSAATLQSPGRWRRLLLVGVMALGILAVLARPLDRGRAAPLVEVVWTFEAERRGGFLAAPLAAGGAVYAAAAHDTVFANAGTVYCLDEATGKLRWRFDDGGKMQHTFSSPRLADGRLYFGEGMHANFSCRLYCLDAASGRKCWQLGAEGHIESTPCVAAGRVYFAAGDDGIYCLDAVSGAKRWQCSGPFHCDADPVVAGSRLYAGSGVSRTKRQTEALCLNVADGTVIWRYPTELPVWGSPVLDGDDVFFGLGNGRLLAAPPPPERPAGGVLCLSTGGTLRWRYDAGDAVFGRVAVAGRDVCFGARDGRCCCLDRATGRLRWQHDLGSPVVTSPAWDGRRLYVIASAGMVRCLDAASGRAIWTFDVAAHTRTSPQLLSSPQVVAARHGERGGRRIYFGSELRNPSRSAAVVFCLRD